MKKLMSLFSLIYFTLFSINATCKDDKWYRVEVIVFENHLQPGWENTASTERPKFTHAIDFSQIPNEKFKILNNTQFTFNDTKAKVQKHYRVIAHTGWIQTLEPKNEATAVRINQGALEGVLRLSGGKYLHLDTDLILNKDNGSFRLKDGSRLRLNEVHYIDHPVYGMLVTVTSQG